MITFALIFALLDVYLVTQLNFWGATPLSILAILYAFRNDISLSYALAATAAYGFVVGSLNKSHEAAILFVISVCLATLASFSARDVASSVLGKKFFRRTDALVMSGVYCAVFWAVQGIFYASTVSTRALLGTLIASVVLNLAMMIAAVLLATRLEVRRG